MILLTAFLLLAHALADGPMQQFRIYRHKRKRIRYPMGFAVRALHIATHGLMTCIVLAGFAQPLLWPLSIIMATHWIIDSRWFWRSKGWVWVDQGAHATIILGISWALTG